MPTMWLSDAQKIGAVFCSGGFIFLALGLLLFFDRAMLSMGNILILIGLPFILGPRPTLSFFARKQKLSGTLTFALGIFMILSGWSMIGFFVECYGLMVLFGDVLVSFAGWVGGIPIVGPYLKKAFMFIGRFAGVGSSQESTLPV